jgi:methyl-accepting chemotaxis protein
MTEQASGASKVVQAVDSMRKGATATARSLAEQSTAIEQVAKETDRLITQFSGLTKAMTEQAKNSEEITAATSDLDQQTREASRAMKEQTISFRQITEGSANVTKQVKLIATSNVENSRATTVILKRIQEVRDVSKQNGQSARDIERILETTIAGVSSAKSRKGGRNAGVANLDSGARA